MVKVEMIRASSTLDRPDFRVTAEDVFDALRTLHNDDEDGKPRAFTTDGKVLVLENLGDLLGQIRSPQRV